MSLATLVLAAALQPGGIIAWIIVGLVAGWIAGVHIALESIRTNAKILRELSSEESEQVLRRIVDELFSIAEPGLLKSALWTRYQRLNSKQ